MEITNQSRRPLTVSLPGGKKLRLGPLKSGQITSRDAEHPMVQKLVNDGIVQLNDGGGATKNRAGAGNVSARQSQRRGPGAAQRQGGDQ
jgi:ribosomal protein L19E